MKKIGTFNFNEKILIIDPCYERRSGMEMNISSGFYNCFVNKGRLKCSDFFYDLLPFNFRVCE